MPQWPEQDLRLVRDLARRCVELACSAEYETRRKRWRDVNERRRPDRAVVWCRPAGVWRELLPPDALHCTDTECRALEYAFRQHLYKDWVGDDHILEPWWPVHAVFRCDSDYTWGLRTGHSVGTTDLGGFRYEPPIRTLEDYDRITVPTYTHDPRATDEALGRMGELLGDAMPVRLVCGPPVIPNHNVFLDQLRGMAPMLDDLAFHPDVVHRAMARITEGCLRAMRSAEESGLLTTNHHEPMFCSDPINGEPADGKVRLHNLWAAANSQEFQNVSPAMHDEFLLNYQMPCLQQFGAVQYGCCEDLTRKAGVLLRIPNLRTFVASAWTDLGVVIEACGGSHTIMWRQSAAAVVFPDDLAPIRAHLDDGMKRLHGCSYQVVLREVETLQGHAERIREWAQTAIEVAEKWA